MLFKTKEQLDKLPTSNLLRLYKHVRFYSPSLAELKDDKFIDNLGDYTLLIKGMLSKRPHVTKELEIKEKLERKRSKR
jgi:hypothetical protein